MSYRKRPLFNRIGPYMGSFLVLSLAHLASTHRALTHVVICLLTPRRAQLSRSM